MYDYKDIRNFYFENEKGQQIDCQKINGGLFLYNVSGLGYEEEIEYERIGNTFIPKTKKIKQNQINGDLEFYDMTYDEYLNFINFILLSSELRLIYIPKTKDRKKYYRDIDFCKIDKTEEDDFNILTCPISIFCKSLWYEEEKTLYTIEPADNEMRWDFEWDSRFTDYSSRSQEYVNKGHVEAPIEVVIEGPVKNPIIELYVEGELYQSTSINVELEEYEKLLYGSKEDNFYLQKQNTDGSIQSLFSLDYLKFYNDEVIRLPRNKSCKILLKADGEILNAQITIYPRYKTV